MHIINKYGFPQLILNTNCLLMSHDEVNHLM